MVTFKPRDTRDKSSHLPFFPELSIAFTKGLDEHLELVAELVVQTRQRLGEVSHLKKSRVALVGEVCNESSRCTGRGKHVRCCRSESGLSFGSAIDRPDRELEERSSA